MKEVKSSTLIISARSHLERVQKILKQVNEVSITSDTHHLNQKSRSKCRSPVHGFPETRAPKFERIHRTLSCPPLDKCSPMSLDLTTEFETNNLRHRQQESKDIEWQMAAMLQQKGRRRSDANSSRSLTGVRLDKTDAAVHLSSSRTNMKNTHILSTGNGMRVSPLAPLNKGRNHHIQKQDRKLKNSKSKRCSNEFSQSDSNISRGCMTYPCYRDRSKVIQPRVQRLSSRSEETSTSDVSNKFGNEDTLPPPILRRAKTESDIVRLEKRVSFIGDR